MPARWALREAKGRHRVAEAQKKVVAANEALRLALNRQYEA